MTLHPVWIADDAPPDAFPDVESALVEPNGLLAIGGNLSPERLVCAYRRGIFPWYSEGQPILWWSPDPRAVIVPERLHVPASLRRTIRRGRFDVTCDRAFAAVVAGCAGPRRGNPGTWITPAMRAAYVALHARGHARSIECWRDGRLVGGLYGITVGRVFCGESMFSRESDASKVALVHLCGLGYALIDCQLPNPHLSRLGAELVSRHTFIRVLERWRDTPDPLSAGMDRAG